MLPMAAVVRIGLYYAARFNVSVGNGWPYNSAFTALPLARVIQVPFTRLNQGQGR